VLTQPLDDSVLAEFDYNMHVMGGDNRMIWILKNRMKKKLLNPCQYLKTYHNHCVGIHGSVRPRISMSQNIGKGAVVKPGGLYE
jgi:hypothetical protein